MVAESNLLRGSESLNVKGEEPLVLDQIVNFKVVGGNCALSCAALGTGNDGMSLSMRHAK
jgi:hypothetical protein